jgi:hypothetical protein
MIGDMPGVSMPALRSKSLLARNLSLLGAEKFPVRIAGISRKPSISKRLDGVSHYPAEISRLSGNPIPARMPNPNRQLRR